jgi:hypothetical protein
VKQPNYFHVPSLQVTQLDSRSTLEISLTAMATGIPDLALERENLFFEGQF